MVAVSQYVPASVLYDPATRSRTLPTGEVTPTPHARERYQARARCCDVPLVEAWRRGTRVEGVETDAWGGRAAVRYWPVGRVLMIAFGGEIRTVIRVDRSALPAYQRAVRRCPAPTPPELEGGGQA